MSVESAWLDALVRRNYEPIKDEASIKNCDGAQMFRCQWWMPLWGCDTLEHMIDDIEERALNNMPENDNCKICGRRYEVCRCPNFNGVQPEPELSSGDSLASSTGSAYLLVTPEILVEILKGLKGPSGIGRRFDVVENALPNDAKLAAVSYNESRGVIEMLLRSKDFDGEYRQLPPPTLKTFYDEADTQNKKLTCSEPAGGAIESTTKKQ